MTDIVERLRASTWSASQEVADEIERLVSLNEVLLGALRLAEAAMDACATGADEKLSDEQLTAIWLATMDEIRGAIRLGEAAE